MMAGPLARAAPRAVTGLEPLGRERDSGYAFEMSILGLLALNPAFPIPGRGVRAARMADLLRVLGLPDHEVWRHPELIAAAIALTHQVGRVVLASSNESLDGVEARVVVSQPEQASDFATPDREGWAWLESTSTPTFVDVAPPLVAPDPLWRRRGLHLVPGRAEALIPQHPRRVPASPAALAATLYLTGRPTLLPTVEFTPGPLPADELLELGLCPLALRGPARRVGRGPGFPSMRPPPGERSPPEEQSSDPELPPELRPLRAALSALCERSSHRLAPGEEGMKTLDREAKKILQAEVAAGTIKGYALAIVPLGDELQDLGMEVVVTLPRRVGQVILRLSPLAPRPSGRP